MADLYNGKECKYANECTIEKIDGTTIADWKRGNRKFYCARDQEKECKNKKDGGIGK